MKTMNNSEKLEKYQSPFPVSYKVIGIGTGATDIIEKVKSLGYDCVGCLLAETSSDCIPMDDDKMVIIVAQDNVKVANAMAKTYHDAGVLTIGLVHNPEVSCYNNIAADTCVENSPDIIKHLLQPIVSHGYICYDFNDLCATLRNSILFKTFVDEGENVEETVNDMKKELAKVPAQHIEALSAHLFFNRDRQPALTMDDMHTLSNLISTFPESIDVIWSVNFDGTMPRDLIRFTIIMSLKGLNGGDVLR